MRNFTVVFLLIGAFQQAPCQLFITEIHPTPVAGEPEWVECRNNGVSAIEIEGWRVCDDRTCVAVPTFLLPAGAYVLFTRDAVGLRESRWIPQDATLVEVPLPSLNNTTDRVEVRRADSSIVDSVRYDVRKHVKGRSIERTGVYLHGITTFTENFAASVSRDSATCGYENSMIELEADLRVASIEPAEGAIAITVVNHGRSEIRSRRISCVVGGMRRDTMVEFLRAGITWQWFIPLTAIEPEDVPRTREVLCYLHGTDDRPENDTATRSMVFAPSAGHLTITEVLFDPLPGMADFIEVWNGGADTVDLSGWIIEDASGARSTVTSALRIAPGGYGVISADTSIARVLEPNRWTLAKPMIRINATTDLAILRTPSAMAVDTAVINASWHHPHAPNRKGRSLEKRWPPLSGKNSASWTSSAHITGSTPGAPNSIAIEPTSATANMQAMPSPFSSNPYHANPSTTITWRIPFLQAVARVSVLQPSGTIVADLLNGSFIAGEGGVPWNGTDALGMRVPVGPYVVVLECVDAASNAVYTDRCIVVVGE